VKKITVYGPGCAKCKQAEELVRRVAAETRADVEVEKVDDIQALVKAGILATPAVAVDGVVKVSGRVPREHEVKAWLVQ
jgi:small redox-active disulfide protein 2